MLITCMANVGVNLIYANWIFEIQILKTFFNQPWARNRAYQICIAMSMQCMGYGIAGIARTCLVFPDYCIYPHNLATIVLNRSLHDKRSGSEWQFLGVLFTRYRYFLTLTGVYFVWHLYYPRDNRAESVELALVSYSMLWKTSTGLHGLLPRTKSLP